MTTTTTTTTAAVVALLVVFAIVWRRRQRWRRRPWLEKLRAEAASKIEKERSEVREPTRKERPVLEVRDAVKRPKERRKRGKEPKAARMTSKRDNGPERAVPELSSSCPSRPQSPHRIPLPPSPLVCSQVVPPALVLSSPASPLLVPTELTITTPTCPPLPPSQKSEQIRKLPEFPPSSPLPPILARKQPPLARRSTPTVSRKPSEHDFPTAKREDEGRKRKPSDVRKKGTPEATQIASLKGALEAARLREEEVAEERKAWQKRERDLQTQVNQLAHQLHALSIACGAYGYGYGGAEPPGQPTNVDQSMTPTLPPLNTSLPLTPNSHPMTPNNLSVPPPNGLPNPLAPSTPTLGPSIYPMPFPPFPYMNSHVHASPMPHSPLPPHAQPAHGSPMSSHGMPPHSPMNFGMTPMMPPPPQHAGPMTPQSPFIVQPWRGASPMHMGPGSSMNAASSMHPGAYVPPGGSPMHMSATSPMHMTGPSRPPFFTGSPRRSRSPYVPHARQGTPSTPSVGSIDDGRRSVGGQSTGRRSVDSHDRPNPDRRPSLKREREPETESETSSDQDSDDDSVIFEDGSVTDSLNLSLLGESLPKVESPTKFDSGEIPFKFTPLSFDSIKRPLKYESAENVVMT